MVSDGLLHVKTHGGKNVYYLSSKGREIIGSEQEVKWSLQVDHSLMRNDMYIFYHAPNDWRCEERVDFMYQEGLTRIERFIVPDATFTVGGVYHFLEVDNTQSMLDNKKKIQVYSHLAPAIEKQFSQKPVLVFYTLTEFRKNKLLTLCQESEVSCKIYTKQDLR